jgi:steroid delta-isomerase-like uncharacterized protein
VPIADLSALRPQSRDVSDQSPAYQLVATDFVGHFPGQPPIEGLEAYRQFGSLYFSAFPDLRITPEDLIAEGDKVTMRYDWRATHLGELMGIPATGKKVRTTGISILRIANGKIAEQAPLIRLKIQRGDFRC